MRPQTPAPQPAETASDSAGAGTEAAGTELLKWEDSLNVETLRLAYEHARETHSAIDATTDVLDRKVVAVFGISSAIATLAPALTKIPHGTLSWDLWLVAGGAWFASTLYSWDAFRPRDYLMDPNPQDLAKREWLSLPPGHYHLARLHYVAKTVEVNQRANDLRAAALRHAFSWALVEVGLLLAALLLR